MTQLINQLEWCFRAALGFAWVSQTCEAVLLYCKVFKIIFPASLLMANLGLNNPVLV